MTLTINQILVFCLIAVLIAFLVEMGILVKHAIPLIKKSKALVESSNKAVDDVKGRADEISDGISNALSSIAADAHPALKALGAVAAGLTAINSIGAVGKGLAIKSGILAAIAGGRSARMAKKEIKKSREAIKQMRKQSKIEKKAMKESMALERKAAEAEIAAARISARMEGRAQAAAARQNKQLAKKAARNDLKALKYERKLAKKIRRAQKRAGTA